MVALPQAQMCFATRQWLDLAQRYRADAQGCRQGSEYTVEMSSPEAGIRRRLFLSREAARLTHDQVASELKVTKLMVSRWERGKSSPTLEEFAQLCEVYGVPCSYILRGTCESAAVVYGRAIRQAKRVES